MCGIFGYIGRKPVTDILLNGLEQLSYRGYDSAGIAVEESNGTFDVRKAAGKLENLRKLVAESPITGTLGIGHTRWATHGVANDVNAHPHTDMKGEIAVVHNGIIENDNELKEMLVKAGIRFVSETDSEVIAHLLSKLYDGDMIKTIGQACQYLRGSYALAVLCKNEPRKLFCARRFSPLIMAYNNDEGYLASDLPALLQHTRNVVFLEDEEIGVLSADGMELFSPDGNRKQANTVRVEWKQLAAVKNEYDHYMLKEIFEQPQAIQNTFLPRKDLKNAEWLPWKDDLINKIQKITIVGCGTAYHSALLAKNVFEKLTKIFTVVETGSEYRYREPLVYENDGLIAVSQSGETADTLAALKIAKEKGLHMIAVCNTYGSGIVRAVGEKNTLYTCAGPEIAVASTKAFVTQYELLLMFGVQLGLKSGKLKKKTAEEIWSALEQLSNQMQEVLHMQTKVKGIARKVSRCKHMFLIGRGLDYALALEAALKLKEVSYLYCEAYPAGEFKHGPIALVEKSVVVTAIITQPQTVDKIVANLQEVKARGASVIVVCTMGISSKICDLADEMFVVPETNPWTAPLLAIVPLQLLAYYVALQRGNDIDQPRNLAKSVSVE